MQLVSLNYECIEAEGKEELSSIGIGEVEEGEMLAPGVSILQQEMLALGASFWDSKIGLGGWDVWREIEWQWSQTQGREERAGRL
jgi:hypothetical protein